MRRLLVRTCGFLAGLLALVGGGALLGGCWNTLSPEKKARIEALEKEIAATEARITTVVEKAKATGDVNLLEIAALIEPMKKIIRDSKQEIDDIRKEAGASGVIGAIFGLVGRTLVHGGQAFIAGSGNPVLQGVSALLTLLLGGSGTKKVPALAAAGAAAPPGGATGPGSGG